MAPPLAATARAARRAAAGASTCSPTSPSRACPASTSSATSPTSPARTASRYPQLGSVALQSGAWAADNILADVAGKPRKPFHYHDKGIMAMIGRGAAIAEVGAHRHELHGVDRLLRLAGRPRRAHDRRAQPHRRVRRLGLGLLLPAAAARRCSTAPTRPGSTGARTPRRAPSPPSRDADRRHDGRPRADPVRDDVDLPLPVRAADARARAAGRRSCRRRGTARASTPGCG